MVMVMVIAVAVWMGEGWNDDDAYDLPSFFLLQ